MLLWLAAACTTPAPPPSPLDGGWIGTISTDPDQLGTLLENDRAGFIALHKNDLPAAIAAGGPPSARGHRALSTLYADLSQLATLSWEETYSTWEARVGLPPGSAIPLVAALAALERGEQEASDTWLNRLDDASAPEHILLAGQLRGGGPSCRDGGDRPRRLHRSAPGRACWSGRGRAVCLWSAAHRRVGPVAV
jgi:hypothetical protein